MWNLCVDMTWKFAFYSVSCYSVSFVETLLNLFVDITARSKNNKILRKATQLKSFCVIYFQGHLSGVDHG